MSEARSQRFEIDIEEIERQLRMSTPPASPAGKPDPLAELARIVGQDDPFKGILADNGRAPPELPSNLRVLRPPPRPDAPPALPAADVAYDVPPPVRHHDQGRPAGHDVYDPVTDAYGHQPEAVYAQDDYQPLRPRRSRGRLVAVLAALVVGAGAVSGGLYWRKSGGTFGVAGAPPLITADRTPLKVPPANPGGVDVPNQNRQIYERGATDGQSRVVDGREQPIDVRAEARNLQAAAPPAGPGAPVISARNPVPSPPDSVPRPVVLPPETAPAAGAAPPRNDAIATALGEGRRVRTSAVRPDGSVYVPTSTASVSDASANLLPGNSVPPPVPVTTVPVPARASVAAAPANPAAAGAQPAAPASGDPVDGGASAAPPARVLPPARPKFASADAAARTAAVATDDGARPAAEKPAGRATYAVQIAVRPTDKEAREAYAQLQEKFASELDGKPATLTRAEVDGKTVHRVRIGSLTKDDANALCKRLKSAGGKCFVTN